MTQRLSNDDPAQGQGPSTRERATRVDPAPLPIPVHVAADLLRGGRLAQIVLDEKVYLLRLTRAGKLILTR